MRAGRPAGAVLMINKSCQTGSDKVSNPFVLFTYLACASNSLIFTLPMHMQDYTDLIKKLSEAVERHSLDKQVLPQLGYHLPWGFGWRHWSSDDEDQ